MELFLLSLQKTYRLAGVIICACMATAPPAYASSNDELSSLDQCLAENPLHECVSPTENNTSGAGGIATKEDSTDQALSATSFRYAGTGLETVQIGEPYDAGTGEFDWRGETGCLKFEQTIKKAQFKREDGVTSELPILDADGNTIPGDELSLGDRCDNVVTWDNLRRWSGGSCGSRSYTYTYTTPGSNGGDIITETISYPDYCNWSSMVGTRTVLRDGEPVGEPVKRTCKTVLAHASKSQRRGGSHYYVRDRPNPGTYPEVTNSVKSGCMGSWGWW